MYTGIQHLHSGMAYLLLAALLFSIIYLLVAFFKKQPFTDKHRKIALIGFIATHLQLLFGLVLYFVSPMGVSNISGEVMKNSEMRLLAVEHPLTMLVAIVLITIGYSKGKKLKEDNARYKNVLIFYGIGFFLILLRIPWSLWP